MASPDDSPTHRVEFLAVAGQRRAKYFVEPALPCVETSLGEIAEVDHALRGEG